MKKVAFALLVSSLSQFFQPAFGQSSYLDSIQRFRTDYLTNHPLFKSATAGIVHYPIAKDAKVLCHFSPTPNASWFDMTTTSGAKQRYRVYGTLSFVYQGRIATLEVYQSQSLMGTEAYANHLFVPFKDAGNGKASYRGGRYLDFNTADFKTKEVWLDFNKAYLPYCAYADGYACPIPPPANTLSFEVKAGEKIFKKSRKS